MTKLYSYKSLKDVPLNKIYSKYAIKEVNILQFRQRIYAGNMAMGEALTTPSLNNKVNIEDDPYINTLYSKLSLETDNPLKKQRFIIKMAGGYAPSEAIKRQNTKRSKNKILKILSTAEIIANLKKQEIKEKKEADKKLKKVKPFSTKEEKYVKNLDVLNSAFNMVRSNK